MADMRQFNESADRVARTLQEGLKRAAGNDADCAILSLLEGHRSRLGKLKRRLDGLHVEIEAEMLEVEAEMAEIKAKV